MAFQNCQALDSTILPVWYISPSAFLAASVSPKSHIRQHFPKQKILSLCKIQLNYKNHAGWFDEKLSIE